MSEREPARDMEGLLPHAGPMRLLSRLLSHTRERTICAVDVSDSELFREPDGQVPACVALEYMAQCVAAHGVLLDGESPRPGLLVGVKHLELHRDRLAPSESLEVTARIVQRIGRLASLACEVRGQGELVAEGVLSVFVPDSLPEPPAVER
ncbi:MAG TPA: 3-hydroxylacyl-ACP dehydratase [Myxococcota bacterium]|nr:3-hydroxylacyl-ACP dehydratase [Myxococcota bacterium]